MCNHGFHEVSNLFSFSLYFPMHSSFQEKPAFIFCVDDRALFCQDCDESIHSANRLAANHQRFLATGIQVALNSNCNKDDSNQMEPRPPKPNMQQITMKTTVQQPSSITSPSWAIDDLLQFSDSESSKKVSKQVVT